MAQKRGGDGQCHDDDDDNDDRQTAALLGRATRKDILKLCPLVLVAGLVTIMVRYEHMRQPPNRLATTEAIECPTNTVSSARKEQLTVYLGNGRTTAL